MLKFQTLFMWIVNKRKKKFKNTPQTGAYEDVQDVKIHKILNDLKYKTQFWTTIA